MAFPLMTTGHVLSHDEDRHAVYVMLKSGESPLLPVEVGRHGPADALRTSHGELPGRGTWGLIAFPHGDARNGVWLVSYQANQLDAFTAAPGESAVRYSSHLSGHWSHMGQDGSTTEVWPDGSSMVTGNGGAVPATYRHILDSTGRRIRAPLTQSQRVPSPPAAFPRVYTHASGATMVVSAAGEISEFSAAGQLIQVGAVGDTLRKIIDERLIPLFNAHVHLGGNGGGSPTGAPTVPLTLAGTATQHLVAG